MAEQKLLEQVSDIARFRHLSLRTEQAYLKWIKRYILFHQKRHPKDLNDDHIRQFLTHLAVNDHVAAPTQNQAFHALLFLYRHVLKRESPEIKVVKRALETRSLPAVFTKEEANAVMT